MLESGYVTKKSFFLPKFNIPIKTATKIW